MAVREYLNNNPAVVTIAAIVLLIVCLALIVRQLLGGGGAQVRDVYYFDTASGQVFIEEAVGFPPIEAPSGPGNGVRAYIYSCGSCEDIAGDIDAGMSPADLAGLGATLLYVERYPPQVVAELEAKQNSSDPQDMVGFEEQLYTQLERAVVKDGALQEWKSPGIENAEAWDMELDALFQALCTGGERPAVCLPPR